MTFIYNTYVLIFTQDDGWNFGHRRSRRRCCGLDFICYKKLVIFYGRSKWKLYICKEEEEKKILKNYVLNDKRECGDRVNRD